MTEGGYVDPKTGEIHVPAEGEAPNTDLVPVGGALEPIPEKYARLQAMMKEAGDRAAMSPEDIQRSILEKILGAATIDEVFAVQEARHARDLLGVPLEVTEFRFNESDFTEGSKYYVVLDCYDVETGDKMAVTCGGATVVAQLYQLQHLGAFPIKVKFTQPLRPTKQGFFPLSLEPA